MRSAECPIFGTAEFSIGAPAEFPAEFAILGLANVSNFELFEFAIGALAAFPTEFVTVELANVANMFETAIELFEFAIGALAAFPAASVVVWVVADAVIGFPVVELAAVCSS